MHRSPGVLAAPTALLLLLGACSQSAPDAGATAADGSASATTSTTTSTVTAAPGSTATMTSTSTSATASHAGTEAAGASGTSLNEAPVGSCWAEVTARDASGARQVDCTEAHTMEAIATKDVLAVGEFDADELSRGLTEACYTAASAYAATEDQGFLLGVPTQEQWDFAAANGATVTETCGIVTGSPTTGTLPPATPR